MKEGLEQKRLAGAIDGDRFEWSLHALTRSVERGLLQHDILKAVSDGERIEDYPDCVPYPAALFLGTTSDGRHLHVVAAYDLANDFGYIITAYFPDGKHFEPDWKTRKELP